MRRILILVLALVLGLALPAGAANFTLYSNDFDGNVTFHPGVTGGLSGSFTLESVQGFAGYGSPGNTFSTNLLRNDTSTPPLATTLTLSGLPMHDSIKIDFLLAFIDSWDSTDGSPSPDYFSVNVDGINKLLITAAQASGSSTYAGHQIASLAQRGWTNAWWGDQAFDMSYEPLLAIAHTGNTLTIDFSAAGTGWQGGMDESWGIENLRVSANVVPIPGALLLLGSGLAGLAAFRKWFRR